MRVMQGVLERLWYLTFLRDECKLQSSNQVLVVTDTSPGSYILTVTLCERVLRENQHNRV